MRVILAAGALLLLLSGGFLLWGEGKGKVATPPSPAPASTVREGAREEAASLKLRAERLLEDRSVRPENLPEAISLLDRARSLLRDGARRDPGPFVAASERLQEAERLRDAAAADLFLDYERKRNLRDFPGAREALGRILRLVPDRKDARNIRARAELARFLRD